MRNPIHRKKLSRARPRPSNNYIQKITKGSALRSLLLFFECNYWRGGDGLYSAFSCLPDPSLIFPPL